MRIFKIILFLICAIAVSNCTSEGSILHDSKGNSIPLTDLKGKWVIINYWADWCDNCLNEIPELNRFYSDYRDKNVVLFGVNYDQMPMKELQNAINKTHIAFPVLLDDPRSSWPLDEIDAIPATFIIDPSGHVAKKLMGENTEKSLADALRELQK